MQCPQCQHEMVESAAGWLCINCGFVQKGKGGAQAKPAEPASSAPPPAPPLTVTTPGAPLETVAEPIPPAPIVPSTSSVSPIVTPDQHEVSGISPAEHNQPLPNHRLRGRHSLKFWLLVGLPIFILVLGTGLFLYQTMVVPKLVLGRYLKESLGAKTGTFKGNITYSSKGGALSDYTIELKMDGQYDVGDKANPKLQLGLDGQMGEVSLNAQIITLDQTFYFKFGNSEILSMFGLKLPEDWYKFSLSGETTQSECTDQSQRTNSILGINFVNRLPLKDAKLVKMLETVDGHRVHHYRGSIDTAKLPAAIAEVNKELPANCQLNAESELAKDMAIDYELWRGSNFDRLRLHLHDGSSDIVLTLDTSNYNQPVDITAPAGAKEASSLLGTFAGDPSDPTNLAHERDMERKNELAQVQVALNEYYVEKHYYPAGNYAGLAAELTPKYLQTLPQDPKEGQSYVYEPTGCNTRTKRCTGFQLKATLEYEHDSDYPTYTTTSVSAKEDSPSQPRLKALLPSLKALVPWPLR